MAYCAWQRNVRLVRQLDHHRIRQSSPASRLPSSHQQTATVDSRPLRSLRVLDLTFLLDPVGVGVDHPFPGILLHHCIENPLPHIVPFRNYRFP